jgi:hypothetical protein
MPGYPEAKQRLANCRTAARLAGVLSVIVGLVVLLGGWAAGIETLKTVLPEYPPMAPNAALGLILFGTALCLDPGVQEHRNRGAPAGFWPFAWCRC